MCNYMPVIDVYAREILNSAGNPAVEVELMTEDGSIGRASASAETGHGGWSDLTETTVRSAPSAGAEEESSPLSGKENQTGLPVRGNERYGMPTGNGRTPEPGDGERRYSGKGVSKACHFVNTVLAEAVIGENVYEQASIDRILRRACGSRDKNHPGVTGIRCLSMAAAVTAAKSLKLPLYRYFGGMHAHQLPVPMVSILTGDCRMARSVDLHSFMILPVGACGYGHGLQMCAEIYQVLREMLLQRNLLTGIGRDGGLMPDFADAGEALTLLSEAAGKAGYQSGKDFVFAVDAAASELYDTSSHTYVFPGESRRKGREIRRSTEEMIFWLEELSSSFPLVSIEDGLAYNDLEGWKELTRRLGNRVQLVGGDLFATNLKRFQKGIREGVGNAIQIKMDQTATLTEIFDVIDLAKSSGYRTVISHCGEETENTLIADLAVACGAVQIRAGAPCHLERVTKYNRLLRIEDALGLEASWDSPKFF